MGRYLEGHPRQPLRLFIPTVWAWDDLQVPTLPVPQSFFPSPKSKCNIDKDVCIRSACLDSAESAAIRDILMQRWGQRLQLRTVG